MTISPKEIYAGVDPGATGALAMVSVDGDLVYWVKFDDESPAVVIASALIAAREAGCLIKATFLERVASSPLMGVVSAFSFGRSYGECWSALRLVGGNDPILVTPQGWQKRLPEADSPKDRARLHAEAAWNLEAFIPDRGRVPHQGAIDAACIADFGRQMAVDGFKVSNSSKVVPLPRRKRRAGIRF